MRRVYWPRAPSWSGKNGIKRSSYSIQVCGSKSSILEMKGEFSKHFIPPNDHENILYSYISLKDHSGTPLSHHVFFWTSCGTLHVDLQPTDHKKGGSNIGKFAVRLEPHNLNWIGFVHLDLEWREKQPGVLEFAVTTAGFAFRAPVVVKLGLMLITSCTITTPRAYTRVATINRRVKMGDWISTRPQQRLLALI